MTFLYFVKDKLFFESIIPYKIWHCVCITTHKTVCRALIITQWFNVLLLYRWSATLGRTMARLDDTRLPFSLPSLLFPLLARFLLLSSLPLSASTQAVYFNVPGFGRVSLCHPHVPRFPDLYYRLYRSIPHHTPGRSCSILSQPAMPSPAFCPRAPLPLMR